jgi:hypothetical protein
MTFKQASVTSKLLFNALIVLSEIYLYTTELITPP